MKELKDIIGRRWFKIPLNQRAYSWNELEIKALIDDLDLLDTRSHYLGPLIITEDPEAHDPRLYDDDQAQVQEVLIEDGQQRFTTLFFLINELMIKYGEHGETVLQNELEKLVFVTTGGNRKLRLRNANAELHQCFEHLVDGSNFTSTSMPMRKMETARNLIKRHFHGKDLAFCNSWKNKLLVQSKLEYIDLSEGDFDRFLTFDAINSRGLPLSQFDKIKNFCVLLDDKRNLNLDVASSWYETLKILEKYDISKRSQEEAFIIELFSTYEGKKYSSKDVHREFVNKYRILLKRSDPMLEGSLKSFIGFWTVYAKSHGLMTTEKKGIHYGSDCTREAGKWLDRLDNMGFPTITRPLLCAGHMNFDQDEFEELVELCEKYTFRLHAVLRRKVSLYGGKIIAEASKILHKSVQLEDAKKCVCKWLQNLAPLKDVVAKVFNDDAKYDNDRSVKGWQHCYYFLYEYEVDVSPRGVPPLGWANDKTLKINTQEHILPKTHRDGGFWGNHWPDAHIADEYKHRLGNLVLTDGNSDLDRKPINEKLNGTPYSYNCTNATNSEKKIHEYTDGNTWTQAEILKREVALIEFVIERWSVPCCSDNGYIYFPEKHSDIKESHKVDHSDCIEAPEEESQVEDDLEGEEDESDLGDGVLDDSID